MYQLFSIFLSWYVNFIAPVRTQVWRDELLAIPCLSRRVETGNCGASQPANPRSTRGMKSDLELVIRHGSMFYGRSRDPELTSPPPCILASPSPYTPVLKNFARPHYLTTHIRGCSGGSLSPYKKKMVRGCVLLLTVRSKEAWIVYIWKYFTNYRPWMSLFGNAGVEQKLRFRCSLQAKLMLRTFRRQRYHPFALLTSPNSRTHHGDGIIARCNTLLFAL